MRVLGLLLALSCIMCSACFAETATYDVYQGWNLVAAPLVPLDSAPASVFSGMTVMNNLQRYDAVGGGDIQLTLYTEEDFGNILLGDGYWLWQDTDGAFSLDGIDDGVPSAGVKTDMWISLPGVDGGNGGWHLIGNPYNHEVPVGDTGENIMFTDGVSLKTWEEASTGDDPWVSSTMFTFDAGGELDISYSPYASMQSLLPFHGFKLFTFKANLAMIINGSVVMPL